jgi:hexosaminidase
VRAWIFGSWLSPITSSFSFPQLHYDPRGEVTDQFFIDQKLWLRSSVLAERLWTPNATINEYCHNKPCSYDNRDLQARMVKNRCRLVQRGILAQPYNTQIIPDRSRWQQCELWLPRNWNWAGR